ncbi:hypothetical protein QQX98_008903 [Neonectria punicea]|uniref:Uncharacterized protein n=1 Tax=Neonectria punicea TaxID=979145 RepID=A0ABR1GU07_9HYPO
MDIGVVKINEIDLPAIDEAFLDSAPSTTQREGMVLKASIGDGDPVALKVFWRAKRPTQPSSTGPEPMFLDRPFEDECVTAALLEKMKWAMVDDDTKAVAGANRTIAIRCGPRTAAEAISNLRTFSDEARQSSKTIAKQPD